VPLRPGIIVPTFDGAALAAGIRARLLSGFGDSATRNGAPIRRGASAATMEAGDATAAGEPSAAAAPRTAPAPDVSVVIPCYNHGQFLADAIRSVTAGTRCVEIIVVDDGSVDGSAEVARAFTEVRYVRQSNQGLAAARNRGLREARGLFVVFLDADDRLLPGAIETGAAALESHPLCCMAFGRCVMMAPDGTFLPTPDQPRMEAADYRQFLRHNPIWMPGMAMFRRTDVELVGGFAQGFDGAADYDLYLRLAAARPVHDHGALVAAYRRHDGNMSRNASRMLRDTHAVMSRRRPDDPHLLSAWREGRRGWRGFYGIHLVEEIRAHVHHRQVLPAVVKILTLVRWNPSLALHELIRRMRTAMPSRPARVVAGLAAAAPVRLNRKS
jgi:glycosyltransferase involved in cell wall biosynthesis